MTPMEALTKAREAAKSVSEEKKAALFEKIDKFLDEAVEKGMVENLAEIAKDEVAKVLSHHTFERVKSIDYANYLDGELIRFVANELFPEVRDIAKEYLAELYGVKKEDLIEGFFTDKVGVETYKRKYALVDKNGKPIDGDVYGTFVRVALATSLGGFVSYTIKRLKEKLKDNEPVEQEDIKKFFEEYKDIFFEQLADFYSIMALGLFTGAGRIVANAGASKYKPNTTLINCTVMRQIPDSMEGIMQVLKEAAITMKTGAGVGYSFSSIRPKGAHVHGAGAPTSGVLSFMNIYDAMCETIESAGGRRGAQMAVLHISHPEVEDYIEIKNKEPGRFFHFNLSVFVTDAFMEAVEKDKDWELWFWQKTNEHIPELTNTFSLDEIDLGDKKVAVVAPDKTPFDYPEYDYFVFRPDHVEVQFGNAEPTRIFEKKVYKKVKAKDLYKKIMDNTLQGGEPGVLFYDTINRKNPLRAIEHLIATNPCVVGDTKLKTNYGELTVEELANRTKEEKGRIKDNDGNDVFAFFTGYKKTLKIITESGKELELTENHEVYVSDEQTRAAKNLAVGDFVITEDGKEKIVNIESLGEKPVYDVSVPATRTWFANGIKVSNCGEQPLNASGSCLLGSVFLHRFVKKPFNHDLHWTENFDWEALNEVVAIASLLMDHVNTISNLPLPTLRFQAYSKRRHGMGFTGLADAMGALGIEYGKNEDAEKFIKSIGIILSGQGLFKSNVVAAEVYGPAYALDDDYVLASWVNSDYITELTNEYMDAKNKLPHIRQFIDEYLGAKVLIENGVGKIRYSHATSIAPAGTISPTLGNNIANGIEPTYSLVTIRNIIVPNKKTRKPEKLMAFVAWWYKSIKGIDLSEVPISEWPSWVKTAVANVSVEDHLYVQHWAQKFIDSAVSKTVNLPPEFDYEKAMDAYYLGWKLGLKGMTTFRFNPSFAIGVLVTLDTLAKTKIKFYTEDGEEFEVNGHDLVEYDGDWHLAANLFEALHTGKYGKYSLEVRKEKKDAGK